MSDQANRNKEIYPDELTFGEFIEGVAGLILWFKSRLLWFLGCFALAGLFSFYLGYRTTPTYEARLSFILNDDSNPQVSNLSGLLGQLGLPIPSGKYNVDKLLEISKSRRLLSSTLFQKAKINSQNDYLANHFLSEYGSPEHTELNVNKSFRFIHNQRDSFSTQENFVLQYLHQMIMGKPDQRDNALFTSSYGRTDYVMTFATKTSSEVLSITFTNELYDQVERFFAKESKKSQELYNLISHKRDSLLHSINQLTYNIAVEKDRSLGTFRSTNIVKVAQLESQLIGLQAAYTEVERGLNNAELALRSNTPLIRLLDRPISPLTKQTSDIKRMTLLSIILGLIFFVSSLTCFRVYQLVQNKISN